MRVAWTPLAEARAAEIVDSMRVDRTGAAWRWLQTMLGRIKGVSKGLQERRTHTEHGEHSAHGEHGAPGEHRAPGEHGAPGERARIAEVFFAPCRIVYLIEPERLVILTLRPAGRHRKSARYEEPPREARRDWRGRSSAG